MPYEMLPPGRYYASLCPPAEGSTAISVSEFADRDGNPAGGLVCNLMLNAYDERGNFVRVVYAENWRGVTLAMRKPTAKCPDGLLAFNWDKLVQIFGLRSRAEVLDLERLSHDPERGPAIMAARFELHVRHETYAAKDAHGMATGEQKVAERYDVQPLGYVAGGGGLRATATQTATLNRFRTLIMANKTPPAVATTDPAAVKAAPVPTTAPAPTRPAIPSRAPALVKDEEDPDQARAISLDRLWSLLLDKWGGDEKVAAQKLTAAVDLDKECAGKEFVDLTPTQLFRVGCNLDIGLMPF